MIKVRKAIDRGHADHGWLDTKHSFSFADYHNPEQMGFRVLRVINEDLVQPNQGFGTHGHRNMEIITYVISGDLAHKDSMGNGSIIRAGDVQYMSAGSGVTHSEFNHSASQPVHFLQIWILPNEKDSTPRYAQSSISDSERNLQGKLLASPDGRDASIAIRQDVCLFVHRFGGNEDFSYSLPPGRYAWVQVVSGGIELNRTLLEAGDGAAIENESQLKFRGAKEGSEILLFDLP